MDNILNAANLYAKGLQEVLDRRKQWLEKYKEVQARMKQVAQELNANAEYKQNFYVDVNHAFNEETSGTCENLPSLTFRSGEMPLMLIFKNAMNDKKEYMESGFHITLTPTVTGEILIMLLPHHTSLTTEKAEYINLGMVENPASLSMEMVNDILAKGIEMAFYSSFTGAVALQRRSVVTDQRAQEQQQQPQQYQPIGFKRHESTEKVK